MKKAILFHDGCNICIAISTLMSNLIDKNKFAFESVNLGEDNTRGQEAKSFGVKRLPSIVVDGAVMKIDEHSAIEHYL